MRAILTIFFSVSTIHVFAEEYIRIGTYNIAEFGEGSHLETRDLGYIAKMLRGAKLDLIAIQEVGVEVDNDGS